LRRSDFELVHELPNDCRSSWGAVWVQVAWLHAALASVASNQAHASDHIVRLDLDEGPTVRKAQWSLTVEFASPEVNTANRGGGRGQFDGFLDRLF
jgi:hypothetical protein